MPAEQQALLQGQLAQVGDALPGILLAQALLSALLMAATLTGLAALGEELGWRGHLQPLFEELGLWRGGLLVGLGWGLWHVPMMLRGANYPNHPLLGLFWMFAFCLLLAPLLGWLRQQGGTVWVAALAHAMLNASASLMMFSDGGSELWVGIAGGAGLLVLLGANLLLALWLRRP